MTTPTVPFYPITHDDGLDIVTALNGILGALNIPTRIIAEEFDSTVAYAVGDYCIYNGTLYRFTSAHSAGAWNSSHVTAVVVGDELKLKVSNSAFDARAPFIVSGNISQGSSATFTDARINSEHWRIPKNGGVEFGTPSNVTSRVLWSTNITNHTVTLTGTFAGATTVAMEFHWYQT